MAQRVMILVYILGVLVVSGFSRADSVELNKQTGILIVRTSVTQNCQSVPKITISSVDLTNRVINLAVTTSPRDGECSHLLRASTLNFDLAQVQVPAGLNYTVEIKSLSGVNYDTLTYTPAHDPIDQAPFSKEQIEQTIRYYN